MFRKGTHSEAIILGVMGTMLCRSPITNLHAQLQMSQRDGEPVDPIHCDCWGPRGRAQGAPRW